MLQRCFPQQPYLVRCLSSSPISPLRQLLETRSATSLDEYKGELQNQRLFVTDDASALSAARRQRLVSGLYHSYMHDGLVDALFGKLVPGFETPAHDSTARAQAATALLNAVQAQPTDLGEPPAFAKRHLKIPPKILGAGHRGKEVIFAEQMAAMLSSIQIAAVDHVALTSLFAALGASPGDVPQAALPENHEESMQAVLLQTNGELKPGVESAVVSGLNFARNRQLLLWQQLERHVYSAE